jgi:hypothetical protein
VGVFLRGPIPQYSSLFTPLTNQNSHYYSLDENREKLEEFVNTINNNDNSHLITVPGGVSPANAVLSSPIMHMGAFAASASGMGGGESGGGAAQVSVGAVASHHNTTPHHTSVMIAYDCEAITQRFFSDFEAITQRLHVVLFVRAVID